MVVALVVDNVADRVAAGYWHSKRVENRLVAVGFNGSVEFADQLACHYIVSFQFGNKLRFSERIPSTTYLFGKGIATFNIASVDFSNSIIRAVLSLTNGNDSVILMFFRTGRQIYHFACLCLYLSLNVRPTDFYLHFLIIRGLTQCVSVLNCLVSDFWNRGRKWRHRLLGLLQRRCARRHP